MNEPNAERGWTLHKAGPGTRNPMVTPNSNQYNSLQDSNSEDMPEPVQTPKAAIPITTTQTQRPPTKEPPTKPTETTTTAHNAVTVVDYSFLDTMSETTTTKTIADYLSAKDVKPIHSNWTIIDVDEFHTAIANALTNITSVYTDKVAEDLGHAYLVDKALQYKKRCGDETAIVPSPQARPNEPDVHDAYAQKLYHYHMKSYRLS